MIQINTEALNHVTGQYGVLEIIDSARIFELPQQTLQQIKQIIQDKHIHTLFVESHWIYHQRIQDIRDFFGIKMIIKIGVETFDDDFRNRVLNKNATFQTIEELNQITSYEESLTYLQNRFAWDFESEAFELLRSLLQQRFE